MTLHKLIRLHLYLDNEGAQNHIAQVTVAYLLKIIKAKSLNEVIA